MFVEQDVTVPTTALPSASDPAYIAALYPSQPNSTDTTVDVDYITMIVPVTITTPLGVMLHVGGNSSGTAVASVGCDAGNVTTAAALSNSTFVGQVALELTRRLLTDGIAYEAGNFSNFSIDRVACSYSGSRRQRSLQRRLERRLLQWGWCPSPPTLRLELFTRLPASADVSLFRARVASVIEAWRNETSGNATSLALCSTYAESVLGEVAVSHVMPCMHDESACLRWAD